MKKIMAVLITTAVLLINTGIRAAEPAGMHCVIDEEKLELSVTIDAGVFEGKTEADLVIMKPGYSLGDAEKKGAIFFAGGKVTDSFGQVDFTVDFSAASVGIYQVCVIPSGSGQTLIQNVSYQQEGFEAEFLRKINGEEGASLDTIKQLLEDSEVQAFLKNPAGQMPEKTELLYRYMISGRPYGSLAEIQQAYSEGIVLSLLQEGSGTERQAFIAQFGALYLKMNTIPEMYAMYQASSHQEAICAAMAGKAETPDAAAEELYESTVLLSVKLSSWGEIPAILNAAKVYLTEIDYEKIEQKSDQVSKAVAGKSYADIEALQAAIKSAYSQTSSGGTVISGGGSGGGGGGGLWSGGIGSGIEVPEREEEYEEEMVLFSDQESIPEYVTPYLSRLKSDGIFEGDPDGSFRPDAPILRQEFCKVLVAALKPQQPEQLPVFVDVPEDAWYAQAVCLAAAAGYVQGKPDQTFGVDETLTREDLAVILERIVRQKQEEVILPETEYSDQGAVSEYAAEAVRYVTGAGLMEGYENIFDPQGQVTRAQAAKVIGKLLYEL